MAKKTQIQIGLLAGQVRRLLDFGREHKFQNQSGELKNATVAVKCILLLIDMRGEKRIRRYLESRKDVTLWFLIKCAVDEYLKKRGY